MEKKKVVNEKKGRAHWLVARLNPNHYEWERRTYGLYGPDQ